MTMMKYVLEYSKRENSLESFLSSLDTKLYELERAEKCYGETAFALQKRLQQKLEVTLTNPRGVIDRESYDDYVDTLVKEIIKSLASRDFEIGDVVKYVKSTGYGTEKWKEDYLSERDNNFPIGSEGEIVDEHSLVRKHLKVAFAGESYLWEGNWGKCLQSDKPNIACFYPEELSLSNIGDFILGGFETIEEAVERVRQDLESDLRQHEQRREHLIHSSIQKMLQLKMGKEEISKYFNNRSVSLGKLIDEEELLK